MKINRLFVISFVVLTLAISIVSAVQPFGVEQEHLEWKNSTRALADVAGNHTAIAGNVTELDIFAYSTTQTWAGYFGNVSGTIQLADSADRVMYNWSLANPEGEVYASENGNVDWDSVDCYPTANVTNLENAWHIENDDVDGIDETFDTTSHDMFYVNNMQFGNGRNCDTARIFDESGSNVNLTRFQEVLMWDNSTSDLLFVSIIEEDSIIGFDGRDHDFQMLVLEDGHGTDTYTRDYYFYVELE